jgi:glycosyltransferase involved in cell wall biosynthesis
VKNAVFVVAGSSRPEQSLNLKYPVYFIPPLKDEVSMPLLYNVADAAVVPSIQENLANSIVESLSCGVPVVAFDVGGNKDMIDHKKNGYLANIYDAKDMAYGIEWVLKDKNLTKLSKNARIKAMDFDSNLIADKYIKLYKEIQKKL